MTKKINEEAILVKKPVIRQMPPKNMEKAAAVAKKTGYAEKIEPKPRTWPTKIGEISKGAKLLKSDSQGTPIF